MQKVLEKVKKIPGKSWNWNQFFWWEPCDIFKDIFQDYLESSVKRKVIVTR